MNIPTSTSNLSFLSLTIDPAPLLKSGVGAARLGLFRVELALCTRLAGVAGRGPSLVAEFPCVAWFTGRHGASVVVLIVPWVAGGAQVFPGLTACAPS